jgi:sugar-specific transcriptional regulator TrmB/DNA-binding CsgD family transcriptional regulator
MLEIIGLDATAEAVYEALVDSPPLTIEEVGQTTALDRLRVRDALITLEASGLVIRTEGNSRVFTVTPPDVALEVLLLEQQERIKRTRLFMEQLAARYRRAAAGRNPAELIEVISGPHAVAQRIEQILRSTSTEVRFIDKQPYVIAPEILAPVEAEMLRRGVPYRGLYDPVGLSTRDIQGEIEPAIAQGEQARVLANTPIKLILADDRLALLPLHSGSTTIESVVVVHPSAMLEALDALFETLWRTALPLPPVGGKAAEGAQSLPQEDARLVALLTAGLPDRIIARQLGLSYRTFQRRIGGLLERLGVRTRFQAGLQASFRGLVPPPDEQARLRAAAEDQPEQQ